MRILNLYSPENPTPRQLDAIGSMLRAYEKSRGVTIKVNAEKWGRGKVLCLGQAPEGVWYGQEFQVTYSPKQFESKANAATVFDSALDNYFGNVSGLPDDANVAQFWYAQHFERVFLERIDPTQPVAVDVETGGVLGETVTSRTAPMITIAFAQGEHAVVLKLWDDNEQWEDDPNEVTRRGENQEFLENFLRLIEKPIFHNGKFDIQVIESNTGVRMPNWFDTMLAHHALNHAAREHGLKVLCKRYFDAEDWEADIKRWIKGNVKDYNVIPRRNLADYNGYDVLWTYRLWQMLAPMIEADEAAQAALFFEMQVADFLSDVEAVGIPFAQSQSDYLRGVYAHRADEALAKLRVLVKDKVFNPGSPQQVKKWLEGRLGYPIASTNEATIDIIKDEALHPDVVTFCNLLIEYRKARKMMSTYLNAWEAAAGIEGDNRVHPTFHVHGTTTGRLSSSDPNAQNVPRDKTIRKMVTLDDRNQLKL